MFFRNLQLDIEIVSNVIQCYFYFKLISWKKKFSNTILLTLNMILEDLIFLTVFTFNHLRLDVYLDMHFYTCRLLVYLFWRMITGVYMTSFFDIWYSHIFYISFYQVLKSINDYTLRVLVILLISSIGVMKSPTLDCTCIPCQESLHWLKEYIILTLWIFLSILMPHQTHI